MRTRVYDAWRLLANPPRIIPSAQCLNMCLRLERPAEALQVCGKAAGVLAAQGMSSSLHKAREIGRG